MEEEEDREVIFEQSMSERTIPSNIKRLGGPVIEELPCVPENDERAIVLFKPMSTPLSQSPSNFSVSVSPDLITGFKSKLLNSFSSLILFSIYSFHSHKRYTGFCC